MDRYIEDHFGKLSLLDSFQSLKILLPDARICPFMYMSSCKKLILDLFRLNISGDGLEKKDRIGKCLDEMETIEEEKQDAS